MSKIQTNFSGLRGGIGNTIMFVGTDAVPKATRKQRRAAVVEVVAAEGEAHKAEAMSAKGKDKDKAGKEDKKAPKAAPKKAESKKGGKKK